MKFSFLFKKRDAVGRITGRNGWRYLVLCNSRGHGCRSQNDENEEEATKPTGENKWKRVAGLTRSCSPTNRGVDELKIGHGVDRLYTVFYSYLS